MLTATALLAALQRRDISSRELVDQAIARIERQDGTINAVVVRDFDRARSAADAADAARARGADGPLLGLPVTVKESFHVQGLPTTWGIAGVPAAPAAADAVTVQRLRAAGAVVLGKTNVAPQLADWQSNNPVYGLTRNPYDPTRTVGGSSGGAAAALAAGYVALELGSDIFGSLRVPAHCCGVYAHKPTPGLLPMRGHAPPGAPVSSIHSPIDLAAVGPMARSASDLALAFHVLAGPDDNEAAAWQLALKPPRHAQLRDYRVLVPDTARLLRPGQAVQTALDRLAAQLESAGCTVVRAHPLLPDLKAAADTNAELLFSFLGADLPDAQYQWLCREVAAGRPVPMPPQMALSHRAWVAADRHRQADRHRLHLMFQQVDVMLTPVLPTPAFLHDDRPMHERTLRVDDRDLPYGEQALWCTLPTMAGLPATAVPAGLSDEGLPIGLQVVGPQHEDLTPLGFAGLLEQAFGGFVPPPIDRV